MTEKERPRPMRTARPEAKSDNTHEQRRKRNPELRVVQSNDDEDDIAVDFGPERALLPEGQWFDARLMHWSTAMVFNTGKVFLHFRIVSPGQFFDVAVFKAFRVKKVITKGLRGKFVLAAAGDLYSTAVRLLDLRVRADRISLRPLQNMLFRIDCRTVNINYKKQLLPEYMQYSVVNEIRRDE